jgi:hypothetical protein
MKKIFWIPVIICACIAHSCKNPVTNEGAVKAIASPVAIDTHPSSCPYFTKDAKGNIVLSWIRSYNDSSAVVCYAVSADSGKTFGNTVEIPTSTNVHPHGENMPKLLFKPDGEIIAAWGAGNPNPKNPYSGLVYYSLSFDNGKTWNGLNELVHDTASNDQRYFDLALLPNGAAAITWLDNRTKTNKEGSTLYFAATNGKGGFANELPIGATCCQCCRTDLFIDSKEGIHVVYRDIINDSIRDMVHTVSTDGGKTFSRPERISKDNWVINGCPHTGPSMAENKNGLHFAWYSGGSHGGIFYCNSADNGKTFSKRDSISLKPTAKHPQIITLQNGDLLTVWDEAVKKGDKSNSWIGAQLRDPSGRKIATQNITPDSAVATFPVIKKISNNNVIIAYTQQGSNHNNYVYYQLLSIR